MSRDGAQRLVEAGAIVEGGVTGDAVDAVTARTYQHPALADRVVIRLVPKALGAAEDLAMEFLGFAPSSAPAEVGTGRRQALGFPAWALTNDPANGHHALALVKDIERLTRLARTKPGNARDGFDELAERLGKSVPHFLPTFYEQAGRAFLASDNKQTAALMFGRARKAEQVHALPIDEDRQRDVFLEFAFSGALSVKALSGHARDLAQRADPVHAYELFLRICLERVAGGLPPYARMAEDLRRLARAARLDAAEQDERLIRALLETPALARAPLAFWRAYAATITRIARADVAVAAQLLNTFPADTQDGVEDLWFDLLESSGAVRGLTEVTDDPRIPRPSGGASAWLERAAAWRARGWRRLKRSPRMLECVARMGERLHSEGRPLDLVSAPRPYGTDLDLVDLCLSLGLHVAVPKQLSYFPLEGWLADVGPGRRDLSALCAAEWAQDGLQLSLDRVLHASPLRGHEPAKIDLAKLRPLLDNAGPRQALARWLQRIADDVESGALPAMRAALDRLAPVAHAAVFAVDPSLRSRLRTADPGRALARTLRAGLLDEFGWPALEEAIRDFPKPPNRPAWDDGVRVADAWPALVLANNAKAVAVGPASILATHAVRRPTAGRAGSGPSVVDVSAEFTDGEFLISWWSASGPVAYWSGRPGDVFDVPSSRMYRQVPSDVTSLPLPSGGRTTGGRPLTPGSRSFAERYQVAGDGSAWYRREARGWREYDPVTGDPGRYCLPAFFEAGVDAIGAELDDRACVLAPVPEGCEDSPLGTAGGLLGWRSVVTAAGKVGTSVDGTTVVLSASDVRRLGGRTPAGSLTLPDGTRVAALREGTTVSFWRDDVVTSEYPATTRYPAYARGTPYVPPLAWWHALRPRDEAGSALLRAVTDEQARRLLAAGPSGVRRVLRGVSHPGLVAGIAGVVEIAAGCAQSLSALPEAVAEQAEIPPEAVPDVNDDELAAALSGACSRDGKFPTSYYRYVAFEAPPSQAFRAIRSTCERVGGTARKGLLAKLTGSREPAPGQAFPECATYWPSVIGGLGAIALRAASAATPERDRAALVALLEAVSETPLAEAEGRWRVVVLAGQEPAGGGVPVGIVGGGEGDDKLLGKVIGTAHGSAVIVHATYQWRANGKMARVVTAVEHSPTGTFGAVPGYTVESSRTDAAGWGGRKRIHELLELIRTRGPAPWNVDAVGELVAKTGLTRAEAGLLLAGLPRIDSTDHNFLDSGTREVLGLKVAEAGSARPALAALTTAARLELCRRAIPDRLSELWDTGPDVAAVAEAWVASFGRRVVVPEELVAEADKVLGRQGLPTVALLSGLVDAANCSWLTVDERFAVTDAGVRPESDRGGLDGEALVSATAGLLWLNYRLPLDSPLRPELPRAYAALRERLRNRELLVPAMAYQDVGGIRRAFGHPAPSPGPGGMRPAQTVALGTAGVLVDRGYVELLYLRPARLSGPQDPLLRATEGVFDPPTAALRLLLDPAAGRLFDAAGVPGAGWVQDPLVSVPEVVAQVRQELGLDESAARLYLQFLALPDPTDKNVARWNGWTPARVRRNGSALLAAGLLVEGKRARAGRTFFLPGGWLDVKAPMLPVEVWKASLLGFMPDGCAPLGVSIPAVPVPDLFTAAWERVRAGDGPALETLRTGRRR